MKKFLFIFILTISIFFTNLPIYASTIPKTKDNDYKILLNFIPNSLEIKDAESFIIIIKKCISSIKELKNAINEKM